MDIDQLKKEILEQRGFRKSYNIDHGLGLLNVENLKGKRVLEVACGEGSLAIYLSHFAEEVVGVDIDENSIEIATKNQQIFGAGNCRFTASDIVSADLPDNYFDLIVGEAALHHIIYDFNIGKRLHELLKPKGELIFISEPLSYNLFSEIIRFLRHHIKHAFGEFSLWYEHIQGFGNQFEKIQYFYFDIFSHPFKAFEKVLPKPLFRMMMKFLWKVDEMVFRTLPFLRKYAPNVNIRMIKKE